MTTLLCARSSSAYGTDVAPVPTQRAEAGQPAVLRPTDPPDAQTFVNLPDWIRSTRMFPSSLFRTARFPVSPIRTSSSAISTSEHSPQPAGQSKTFTFSMCDCPPFWTLKPSSSSCRSNRSAFDLNVLRPPARTHTSGPGTPAKPARCTSLRWAPRVLDAGADHGVDSATASTPSEQPSQGRAHFGKVREGPVEVGHLTAHEVANVWARSASQPLDRNDLFDLLQREAQSSGLRHEGEERQRVVPVKSVAGCAAAWRRENPRSLVETQRLPADATSYRDLPDEQAVPSHDHSLNPAPRGKVKRQSGGTGPLRRHLNPLIACQFLARNDLHDNDFWLLVPSWCHA